MKKKNKKLKTSFGITFEKKNDQRHLPLLHVEWLDHAVSGSSNWHPLDDVKVQALSCFSIGWLVDESEDAIALAQNIGTNGTVGEIMTILKKCIIKRKVL